MTDSFLNISSISTSAYVFWSKLMCTISDVVLEIKISKILQNITDFLVSCEHFPIFFISIFLPLAYRFFIKEFIPDGMLVSLKLLRICRVGTILILMSILYIFLVQTTLGLDIFCFRFIHHNWGTLGKRTKTFS